MNRTNHERALIHYLRARLFRLRFRRVARRRLAAMKQDEAERRERERVHAAWMREACDPEALRIAALMVERAEMAVTV